ncbi:hypothetical protein BBBOND_0404930 [Babesia bigemina]|uniref:Uncharacterized protein n=1 Tax=Babesia bigemina TaxID=5866 RepID=A0A061DBR2_BABBI|nr:hypothetical protein BBBOND_0404930 [Babesia bigemina]CDR98008.1 hypothetical protein BBBOND_0404930 [Babesia bigemina]|eukprot:XP_012770194.1 hypothetical protein BBBOND_0404930 [Babesia bigemina]
MPMVVPNVVTWKWIVERQYNMHLLALGISDRINSHIQRDVRTTNPYAAMSNVIPIDDNDPAN